MRRVFRAGLGWVVAIALCGWAGLAAADPPVWHVHGPQGEVTLFGSVHVLTPGLDWRKPSMTDDLARASEVWFEIPMDGSTEAETAKAVDKVARLPAGQTLSGLLSTKGRARLKRLAAKYGLTAQTLDIYRPWFAEVTLTLLDLRARGASQGDGVEPSLSREAPAAATRHAFETPEEQIHFLSDAPVREQVASLEESLRQIEEEPESFDELEKAWLSGDTRWLEREAIIPLRKAAPGVYRRLVSDRNHRWVGEIERLLKSPDRAFIVVGIGHLVGAEGVPALLRKRGWQVDGP